MTDAAPSDTSGPSSPPRRAVVLILALAGLFVCWTMLLGYLGRSPLLESRWLCGGQETGGYGCAGVFASRFGKMFGMPMPAFRMLYFLAIGLWVVVFGKDTFNPLLALLLSAGVGESLLLLYILYFVLSGQCRWCLIVHLVNLSLAAVALVGCWRFYRAGLCKGVRMYLARAVIVGLVVFAAAGWGMAAFATVQTKAVIAKYTAWRLNPQFQRLLYHSQQRRDIPITDQDRILGPVDAAVTIVIYKDFQCEHCGACWQAIHDLYRRKYAAGGKVAIVLRHWPWSNRCNDDPDITGNPHPYACQAAYAAEAVALIAGPQAFWAYHDLLIKNHDRLDRSPYVELARRIGIDREAFIKVWRGDAVRRKVQADTESARVLGIPGVPAVFVNGRSLADGWRVNGLLEQIINDQIRPDPQAPAASRPAAKKDW